MTDLESRIRDSFDKQGFLRTVRATLVSVEAGAVEIRMPIHEGVSQQHGFVHAGVVSALGDTAAGYAAMSLLPDGAEVLTAEFKINLLAPARGEELVARGRVLRRGRTLSVAAADVFALAAGQETCVATLLVTLVGRERPPAA